MRASKRFERLTLRHGNPELVELWPLIVLFAFMWYMPASAVYSIYWFIDPGRTNFALLAFVTTV